MRPLDKVRSKLLLQFERVSRKIKPERNTKEVSNHDVTIALYQYATCHDARNEYGENNLEWIHERLIKLDPKQMTIVRLHFFEGKTLREISKEFGREAHWGPRKLKEILEILRKA